MTGLLVTIFMLFLQGVAASSPAPKLGTEAHFGPGLEVLTQACSAQGGDPLRWKELRIGRENSWAIEVVRNPGARRDPRCPGDYGGTAPEVVLQKSGAVAAVNGLLFIEAPKKRGAAGYAPKGLIWSSQKGGVLISPLRPRAGERLFYLTAADSGEHLLTPADFDDTKALVTRMKAAHPGLQLLLQLKSALHIGDRENHYTRCTPEYEGNPAMAWACRSANRTLLCARRKGPLSFYVVEDALVYEASLALRADGPCGTGCTLLYNLDGGGSTQLGYRKSGRFQMSFGTENNVQGCSTYRPVDHHFIVKSMKRE